MDIGGIEYLGLQRVLERSTGEIVAERDDALLIRDSVSGAYFLACEDETVGIRLLDHGVGQRCDLLMVSNEAIGHTAFERYCFSDRLVCYPFAYYGEKPADCSGITVRTADERDLPMLTEHYRLISPQELETVVNRGSVLIGYDGDRPVGFVGEHLEGSMGLLYVFEEYRRRGYGAALQRHMIAGTMEAGYIPFGQVEVSNTASLCLQEKLGMTRSDQRIVWMWK